MKINAIVLLFILWISEFLWEIYSLWNINEITTLIGSSVLFLSMFILILAKDKIGVYMLIVITVLGTIILVLTNSFTLVSLGNIMMNGLIIVGLLSSSWF